jgi:hypothetical protein
VRPAEDVALTALSGQAPDSILSRLSRIAHYVRLRTDPRSEREQCGREGTLHPA